MPSKSQLMSVSNGTDKFFFKASIAIYQAAVAGACGFTIEPAPTKPVALVDQGELIRCGLCTKLQVRLNEPSPKPPSTITVLVGVEDTGLAMQYFNSPGKTINGKTVLGANFKRDKFYA